MVNRTAEQTPEKPPVRKSATAKTLSAAAVARLRADILSCAFAPGEKLRLDALKNGYGVGYSPLREALVQLAAEGFVELEGQKGFRVAPVSQADLQDTMQTRIDIERLALRDALPNGNEAWEARIVAAFYRLSRQHPVHAEPRAVNEAWFDRHREFHFALVAAARSEMLKKFWMMAYDKAERYRRLSVTCGSNPRDDTREHEALMEAVLARDVEEACRLSEHHIGKTLQIILYDVAAKMPILDGAPAAPGADGA